MRKKLFIIFSIIIVISAIILFLVLITLNKKKDYEVAKSNIGTSNVIENNEKNELVNEFIEESSNEIVDEVVNLPETSTNEIIVTSSNNSAPVTTKEENKTTTKTESKASVNSNNSSTASTTINTPVEEKREEPTTTTTTSQVEPPPTQVNPPTPTTQIETPAPQIETPAPQVDTPPPTTTPEKPVQEEKPQVTNTNARPELAYSTYREVNTSVVPEIIRILNNEISTQDDLVAYGSKALTGNAADAKAKTNGFTYMLVKDIHKGKVAGNYTVFEQRVRNNVGGFANYNVYAEDEFTYDGQGLNPKWSQTLVWIYLTF